jgi:hypothetical protein
MGVDAREAIHEFSSGAHWWKEGAISRAVAWRIASGDVVHVTPTRDGNQASTDN